MARIDEIGPDIFRISIYVPQYDMQFNQFLIRDEEPLLYTTGFKAFFPEMKEAVAQLIDPTKLRWIGFSHFESDECGSLNQWLEMAPQAEAVTGIIGAIVNLNDFALRPARALEDQEVFSTGKKRFRYIRTPHVPHGWDAGLLFEESERTLLTSDLFGQNGNVEPITENTLTERCLEELKVSQQGPLADYVPYSSKVDRVLRNLAELRPKTLAVMHGSSFSGDGKKALEELAEVWKEVLSE